MYEFLIVANTCNIRPHEKEKVKLDIIFISFFISVYVVPASKKTKDVHERMNDFN